MNVSLSSEELTPIVNTSNFSSHWISKVDLATISKETGTPTFIYNEAQLIKNIRRIKSAISKVNYTDRVSIYVPFFPNSNPHVLKPLIDENVGVLLQLPNEYELITQYGFSDFIISPGHISNDEISFWNSKGYPTFLASIDEVAHAISENAKTLSIRIDSLGSDKAGIKLDQLGAVTELISINNRDLECFEVYCGSGNSLQDMVDIVRQIFQIYHDHFPTAKSVNFAGGHGFNYEKWGEEEKHFDWDTYFAAIRDLAVEMSIPDHVKFLFEPARDVLADTGVLIADVKRDIVHHSNGQIVVTDASRMLMPSAQLRNRAHNTIFLTPEFNEIEEDIACIEAKVRGRTILRNDYLLPGTIFVPEQVCQGSYMLVMDVGAYCATQHMEFLNVPPAAEVIITKDDEVYMITKPGPSLDKWRNLLREPNRISPLSQVIEAA